MEQTTHRILATLAAAVAALLVMAGCGGGPATGEPKDTGIDSTPLVFASVPSRQPAITATYFQPILEMLEEETGREIRVIFPRDYAALIEGARTGELDIMAFGPLSYIRAKLAGARITVVAARVNWQGAEPGYRSYGVTRAGSPIEDLEDFRGKRVCLVDENSASGYLYPKAALFELGIELATDTEPVFTGSHDASVLAVADGRCEAGFALDTIVDRQLIERGQIREGEIVTVWRSDVIPGGPLAISDDLDEELRQQLTTALQTKANADYLRDHGFCQGECALTDGDTFGFAPAIDGDYKDVREVCRAVGEEACR